MSELVEETGKEPVRRIPLPKNPKRWASSRPLPWALIRFVVILLILTLAGTLAYRFGYFEQYRTSWDNTWAWLRHDNPAHSSSDKLFTCPMHPEILRDRPGECPICGMDLVEKEKPQTAGDIYTCPMHPDILRDRPGECPICGMDLVKKETETPPEHSEHPEHPGQITVDPRMLQTLGVKTEVVQKRYLSKVLRPTGRVQADDSESRMIHSWVAGRIDKVYVDEVGQKIKRGDPLVAVYSPQLLASQEEFLSALAYLDELEARGALPQARADAQDLIKAAEKRLRLWGLKAKQLEKLRTGRKAQKHVVVYATLAGTVMEKMAHEGLYVKEGSPLYGLLDLREVWVYLDVFENDMAYVHEGMSVRFSSTAYPQEIYFGKVSLIEPTLNEKGRTARVRVEFDNRGQRLLPGMYVEARVEVAVADGPSVSNLAVIRSGKRDLVLLDLGEGRVAPREVTVGPLTEGYYPILSGVSAGQRVISQASFLLDSESQLKNALQQMEGGHQH